MSPSSALNLTNYQSNHNAMLHIGLPNTDWGSYQACYYAGYQSEYQENFVSETLSCNSHTATASGAAAQFSPLALGKCHCLGAGGSWCWTSYTAQPPKMAVNTQKVSPALF